MPELGTQETLDAHKQHDHRFNKYMGKETKKQQTNVGFDFQSDSLGHWDISFQQWNIEDRIHA